MDTPGTAMIALFYMTAKICCAAVEEIAYDLVLIQPKRVSLPVVSDMFAENVGNLNSTLFMVDNCS